MTILHGGLAYLPGVAGIVIGVAGYSFVHISASRRRKTILGNNELVQNRKTTSDDEQKTEVPAIPVNINEDEIRKRLSTRELDVLHQLSFGRSYKEISYHLGVTEATIKIHIKALIRKLEVQNRSQALLRAEALGLIDLEELDVRPDGTNLSVSPREVQ